MECHTKKGGFLKWLKSERPFLAHLASLGEGRCIGDDPVPPIADVVLVVVVEVHSGVEALAEVRLEGRQPPAKVGRREAPQPRPVLVLEYPDRGS